MWIMMRQKLPCEASPPKLSIFWSTPWPNEEYARSQAEENDDGELEFVPPEKTFALSNSPFGGLEHNWNGARRIRFDDKDLRVFPNEFTVIPSERLLFYIENGVYEMVAEGVASDILAQDMVEGEKKVLWEHALVDGCTDAQARLVAMGVDITLPDPIVPPTGWYRCHPAYASHFCHEEEMTETRTGRAEGVLAPHVKSPRSKRKTFAQTFVTNFIKGHQSPAQCPKPAPGTRKLGVRRSAEVHERMD
jgi:hypothetical protein